MDFVPQGYTNNGIALFGHDDQSMVKFFKHPTISKAKSDEAGVPVYEDVEMVSVIFPGEKEAVCVIATEWHKRRFPRQYEVFKTGSDQTLTGTPLDHLFPSDPGAIMNLKSFNVFTVQQLAALTDTAIMQIPMGRQLTDRAKAYLGSSNPEYHAMKNRIDELEARLNADVPADNPAEVEEAPVRRGPGRPPKVDA